MEVHKNGIHTAGLAYGTYYRNWGISRIKEGAKWEG